MIGSSKHMAVRCKVLYTLAVLVEIAIIVGLCFLNSYLINTMTDRAYTINFGGVGYAVNDTLHFSKNSASSDPTSCPVSSSTAKSEDVVVVVKEIGDGGSVTKADVKFNYHIDRQKTFRCHTGDTNGRNLEINVNDQDWHWWNLLRVIGIILSIIAIFAIFTIGIIPTAKAGFACK